MERNGLDIRTPRLRAGLAAHDPNAIIGPSPYLLPEGRIEKQPIRPGSTGPSLKTTKQQNPRTNTQIRKRATNAEYAFTQEKMHKNEK
jgi:hypothetical protein